MAPRGGRPRIPRRPRRPGRAQAGAQRLVGVTRRIASAIASRSSGSNSSAASPQTSASEPRPDAATGTAHAIASSGGRPKPSKRLGKTTAAAPRYSPARSPAGTWPRWRTLARVPPAGARGRRSVRSTPATARGRRRRRTRRAAARGSCAATCSPGRARSAPAAPAPPGTAARRREALVVDAQRDRPHAVGRHADVLDDPLPRVLGDRQHEVRLARRAVVGPRPQPPLQRRRTSRAARGAGRRAARRRAGRRARAAPAPSPGSGRRRSRGRRAPDHTRPAFIAAKRVAGRSPGR